MGSLTVPMVGPLKSGDTRLQTIYDEAMLKGSTRLLPVTQPILRNAAQLRASIPSLRTPDAIHAATGLFVQCAQFLTNDNGYRKVPGLPLVVLGDLVQP